MIKHQGKEYDVSQTYKGISVYEGIEHFVGEKKSVHFFMVKDLLDGSEAYWTFPGSPSPKLLEEGYEAICKLCKTYEPHHTPDKTSAEEDRERD